MVYLSAGGRKGVAVFFSVLLLLLVWPHTRYADSELERINREIRDLEQLRDKSVAVQSLEVKKGRLEYCMGVKTEV